MASSVKSIENITKKLVSVKNMDSINTGRPVANQFIIEYEGIKPFRLFKSYDSIIAIECEGKVYLDKDTWDYSVTTGKYRNIFLGEDTKETKGKIKDGTYILANLNMGE